MKSIDVLTDHFGEIKVIEFEPYNEEYEGILFRSSSNNLIIRSRLAKPTPKKVGYFTAFWEKNQDRKNQPFNVNTSPEFLAIVVSDQAKRGLFLLPITVAIEKKIYSSDTSTGKMAMRFYPNWCDKLNKTAIKTQQWQLNYFTDLSIDS